MTTDGRADEYARQAGRPSGSARPKTRAGDSRARRGCATARDASCVAAFAARRSAPGSTTPAARHSAVVCVKAPSQAALRGSKQRATMKSDDEPRANPNITSAARDLSPRWRHTPATTYGKQIKCGPDAGRSERRKPPNARPICVDRGTAAKRGYRRVRHNTIPVMTVSHTSRLPSPSFHSHGRSSSASRSSGEVERADHCAYSGLRSRSTRTTAIKTT